MELRDLDHAIKLLEKANASLEPERLSAGEARTVLARYARAEKLCAFGVAALARKLDDAPRIAQVTGTSVGKAKAIVTTGKTMAACDDLHDAMAAGKVSLDQAGAIASAEQASPGAAAELVEIAQRETFLVLKDTARRVVLDAERDRGLAARQRDARCARARVDDLGMVELHLRLEPHVGTPIVNRADAHARRLARAATATGEQEPFERHLADAYAALLAGGAGGAGRRPELVVLVSHEVAARGWSDVRADEVCKIPGVGPVAPEVAREIAENAFLSGVFFDGTDLRHFRRWGRHVPVEVALALELGDPPAFDGLCCTDCGNRFRPEIDHVVPRFKRGPTAHANLAPRCFRCHRDKTARDLRSPPGAT